MADGDSPAGSPFTPTPVEKSDSPWKALAAGVILVAAVVALLAWIGGGSHKPAAAPNPYIAKLQVSDLKLAAAQNFVGGTVTYLEGKIANRGDKTVTRVEVEVIFRNSLGEVVQKETLPLRVLQFQGPDRDIVDMRVAPLRPGQAEDVRLTIEGTVSADWNQQYPELRITSVTTQ